MKELKKIICKATRCFTKKKDTLPTWEGSAAYWEKRYAHGGNSGIGSYGRLAEFKASVINQFVAENNIQSVIEWGCGDGNQLLVANYPQYTGFDVSREAIAICKKKFKDDPAKAFFYCGDPGFHTNEEAELTLSLDVIYHLIEDDVFKTYMRRLFETATRYVCIYSCNDDAKHSSCHVKHRKFTDWIDNNLANEWGLLKIIPNKYPYDPNIEESSWSDFYFFNRL